jgi:hypothetical protein
MSGYIGWLEKEDHRVLRQVMREVYPTVRELELERNRTSLRPRTQAEPTASLPLASAVGSDKNGV